MRESLDPWPFVYGAYAVGLIALVVLIVWAYRTMRAAEKRREELRKKK